MRRQMTFLARRSTGLRLAAALSGLAALGASTAAVAGDPPPAAPPAHSSAPPSAAPAQPPKRDTASVVSCRDYEVTGSHISRKRVCHTKREWDDLESQTQETILQNTIAGSGNAFPH